MITVERALELLEGVGADLDLEHVELHQAAGRILGSEVSGTSHLPTGRPWTVLRSGRMTCLNRVEP